MPDPTPADQALNDLDAIPPKHPLARGVKAAKAATLRWTLVERYAGQAFGVLMQGVKMRVKGERWFTNPTPGIIASASLGYGRMMAEHLLAEESIEDQLKQAIAGAKP